MKNANVVRPDRRRGRLENSLDQMDLLELELELELELVVVSVELILSTI
jgi:hypothetical protein